MSLSEAIDQLEAVEPTGDIEHLTTLYLQVKAERDRLAGYLNRIETALLNEMGDRRQIVLEGVAVIERKSGAKRSAWEDEMVAPAAVTEYVKQDTGELLDPMVVDSVVRAFLAAARPSWRVTELKRLGIDPSRYCKETWGDPRAVVRAVEGAA